MVACEGLPFSVVTSLAAWLSIAFANMFVLFCCRTTPAPVLYQPVLWYHYQRTAPEPVLLHHHQHSFANNNGHLPMATKEVLHGRRG